MEVEDQATILLELKYCERCGELWVRPSGSEEVYCASCAIEMADLRFPAKRNHSAFAGKPQHGHRPSRPAAGGP